MREKQWECLNSSKVFSTCLIKSQNIMFGHKLCLQQLFLENIVCFLLQSAQIFENTWDTE